MPTSVRLEKELEDRLDRLAKDSGRTKADYLREIITRGIEDMEDIHVADQAYLRIQQGLEEGTELVFTLEGDELRVASMTTHLKQIQEKVRNFLPQDVSLVDELIDERRREAKSY